MGYADVEFVYRLWNPNDGKVYTTWDVVFWEDESIEDFDESIWQKVLSERVERVVVITFENHTNGDAAIPHEQENENVEENEEPNEPPASDHVDDSDDVEDGGDHVHDDESHGNEVERALNDEPVTIELRRSSRVPKPLTRYHSS